MITVSMFLTLISWTQMVMAAAMPATMMMMMMVRDKNNSVQVVKKMRIRKLKG